MPSVPFSHANNFGAFLKPLMIVVILFDIVLILLFLFCVFLLVLLLLLFDDLIALVVLLRLTVDDQFLLAAFDDLHPLNLLIVLVVDLILLFVDQVRFDAFLFLPLILYMLDVLFFHAKNFVMFWKPLKIVQVLFDISLILLFLVFFFHPLCLLPSFL